MLPVEQEVHALVGTLYEGHGLGWQVCAAPVMVDGSVTEKELVRRHIAVRRMVPLALEEITVQPLALLRP